MQVLTELAGNPQRCAPSIHIAGSKGKGSVTGMLAAMLTAGGFRAARYMSPHVIDIRERICLGNSYFSEDIYVAAGNELRYITEVQLPALANPLFDLSTSDGCEPTYFELLTLFFFLCARLENCNAMVVETGMGGRLDSTNVLEPVASVITIIELEHTEFLGHTITAIAEEKAGIIKQGKPLILAKQKEEAYEIFKKKTEEKNSPLFYLSQIAELSNINVNSHGTDFALAFKASGKFLSPATLPFSIPIPGKVQAENAALAIAAVKTAFPQIGEDAIRRGLKSLNIPGRFEKIVEQPPFIIDGAHTPESLVLCVETFCSLYGEGGVLVFGCAADKDAAAMAKIVHSHFAKIIITTPGTFKVSNPPLVYETFANTAGLEKTLLVTDTQEAVRQALEFARKNNLPVLGTGSFYLVSEIRKIICN
ncbi:MAG: tetrahydrofolate synthase [Treponema sp.]|jgi:dihydrofolate synthase/folylpolyglutamate synthase|nr:tetrahydrofolate synthase [Treponema sp.]